MFNKIYVFSPTKIATGGTELLQQLVYKLRQYGQDAYIHYTETYNGSNVEKVFGPRYNNPQAYSIDDKENNLIIVSESAIFNLLSFKRIQKAVWWLSVDFYGGSFRLSTDYLHKVFYKLTDTIYSQFDKHWLHLVQSEYAYQYCINERKIGRNNIYRLSDYLSKDFIANADCNEDNNRKDVVLFNPKKGIEFTKQLIEEYNTINWIPIQNMTSKEIVELMKDSKVYIDFGNHPGKDRIPREAAICGCCIITGYRGSAQNKIDIPIPDSYKFLEKDKSRIIRQIYTIFTNFNECKKDFEEYVTKIKSEEIVFEKEVKEVFIEQQHQLEKPNFWQRVFRPLAKWSVYSMKFGPTLFGYN